MIIYNTIMENAVTAILTEIRKDGMQKWERTDLPRSDHMRYLWLNAYQSLKGVAIGTTANLVFEKGTGGVTGGHWAVWKVKEIIMTKEQFIRDPARIPERRARGIKYVVIGFDGVSFFEFATENQSQTMDVARHWCEQHHAIAECFCVQNGEIGGRPFHTFL